jgi:hypothetical protein
MFSSMTSFIVNLEALRSSRRHSGLAVAVAVVRPMMVLEIRRYW